MRLRLTPLLGNFYLAMTITSFASLTNSSRSQELELKLGSYRAGETRESHALENANLEK